MLKRFGRFIILSVIGFALGAGLAYFQVSQEANVGEPSENVAMQKPAKEHSEGPLSISADGKLEVSKEAKVMVGADAGTTDAGAEGATNPAATEPAASSEPAPQSEVAGSSIGGAFLLTDHNGAPVTEKSWPGKFRLVFFGFTHCPDICPTTLDKLTGVLNDMGADADKIQTLFVTTDPSRDTAPVMKEYVANYHSNIVGLTGTEAQIKEMENIYKVYAARVPDADGKNYTMNHSSYVFMMSPDDKLLEIFKGDDTGEAIEAKIKERLSSTPVAVPAPVPGDMAVAPEAPAEKSAPESTPDAAPAEQAPETNSKPAEETTTP